MRVDPERNSPDVKSSETAGESRAPSKVSDWKCVAALLAGMTLPGLSGCGISEDTRPQAGAEARQMNTGKILQRAPLPGEASITAAEIKSHLTFLAKDEHKGRDTGKGHLEGPVTEYVEKHWKDLGLKPLGNKEGDSFRQPFSIRTWDDGKKMEHPHAHFGHLPNEGGIAISPDGEITTMSAADKLRPLSAAALKTHNLIAVVEGRDPVLKNEYIVIGAHLDHIGERAGAPGDNIYNGADDNGSGSSAILAISKALSEAQRDGRGPARSVIIMLFSGEELGLLGSEYFVKNPTVPLKQIKAMINLDMIGRLDPAQVSIFDNNKDGRPNFLHGLHDTEGTAIRRIDHNVDSLVYRSDQHAFYQAGIDVMFFFEGFTPDGEMNPDYHGLRDHADRIDYDKVQDIARLAYRHLMGAANRPAQR